MSSLHMDPNRTAFKSYQSPTTRRLVVSKVSISADVLTVEYVAAELLKIAHSVFHDQSAMYIHPHMKPRPQPVLLQSDTELSETLGLSCNNGTQANMLLCVRVCRLLSRLRDSSEPLHEILHAFQILLSHITQLLFSGDLSTLQLRDKVMENMREVAVRLVKDAQAMMPKELPRWQTWVLAESVRRAILMSCLIQGVYHGWVRGYCYHELFIQALPFDVRAGLWVAGSADEWEALLVKDDKQHGFDKATTDLVSFHEFAFSFAKVPFDPGADSFQRLLLTAHHGKGPVDRALGCLKA